MKKNLNRKRKTKNPCSNCGLHQDRCICAFIPDLDLKTKLCLLIHRRELKRTTNTGMLAIKALKNSEVLVRGALDKKPLDLSHLANTNSYQSVLFFPADDAIELNRDFVEKFKLPLQLIVPDGNWRQASKVLTRHRELDHLPRVKLSNKNISKFHLRKEHFENGLSTLQSIACALGIIEGPDVGQALLDLYEHKLINTIKGRGQLHAHTD